MKKIIISGAAVLLNVSVFAQSPKAHRTTTESTSVSVSSSDHDYSVVANFDAPKADKLKKLLIQRLGNPNKTRENNYEWSLNNSYTVTLKSGKLIIDLNKDKTTAEIIKTFERLGRDVQPALESKI